MIEKEKIIKILESYVVEGYRRERIIDEISIDDIAEEIVKNCSIPNVVGRSEQLPPNCHKCGRSGYSTGTPFCTDDYCN